MSYLPPAPGAAGARTSSPLLVNSQRNSDLASFLSTSNNNSNSSGTALSNSAAYHASSAGGQSLISGSHAGVGMSYGLSAPHYVTLEEFGQMRRQMEKERSYRDDVISRMKTEILELRERQRISGGGGGGPAMDPSILEEAEATRGSHSHHHHNSALMSSPPRMTSRLHGSLFDISAHHHHNSNDASAAASPPTSGTLINRIEHLEAFKLSVPPQLDAMEERVRTIVEERMREVTAHSQLAGLLAESAALAKRVDELAVVQQDTSNMLEHDVARNAPVQQTLEQLSSSVAAVAREVEQLHGFRLTTDDARIKLENDVRWLRGALTGDGDGGNNSGGGGGSVERMIEAAVERRLTLEREETRDMIRREARRLRDEILDSQTQMRVEIEAAKRQLAVRNAKITNSELESELDNDHRGGTPDKSSSDHHHHDAEDADTSSVSSPPALLRNQQTHHKQQEQLVEQRLRHLETQLSSQLGDATRHLEAKLLTRVREMAESSRSVLGEEITERLDVQLGNVQTTLREDLAHELTRHLDSALKKEADKMRRTADGGSSGSRPHSRSNSDALLGFYGPGAAPSSASAGAPDIILDGVDLFLRELPLDNSPLFAQCAELINDCRARGRTTPADAMLLLFKFLRGHLSSFSVLAENVAELKYAVISKNDEDSGPSGNSSNPLLYQQKKQQQQHEEQMIEESGIVANIVQDVDAMISQFANSNSNNMNAFAPCADYVEYCKAQDERCGTAMALQLFWLFFRGFFSMMGAMGGRIDGLERRMHHQ